MIDPGDLALLAKSFAAALERNDGGQDVALHELGWADLLSVAPQQGAAAVFELLGITGSSAPLLDDVIAAALGVRVSADTCVVLPSPHGTAPPGRASGARLVVEGVVSSRIETATQVVVPVSRHGVTVLAQLEPSLVRTRGEAALDPAQPFRRLASIELEFDADAVTLTAGDGWSTAVRDARIALASQLIGASRKMLELARTHALDRNQFGRPVASFQAVRHKLAESLVAIEGAAGVAAVAVEAPDELTAAVAKSLAGKAARTTAAHAQQVLAGVGFTTELPFHLYLKRTIVLDALLGSAHTLPTEIGRALLARRGAPRLIDL